VQKFEWWQPPTAPKALILIFWRRRRLGHGHVHIFGKLTNHYSLRLQRWKLELDSRMHTIPLQFKYFWSQSCWKYAFWLQAYCNWIFS
jgi:hypothetical protein